MDVLWSLLVRVCFLYSQNWFNLMYFMAMFDAYRRFEEVIGQLSAFVDADIANRVRTRLEVYPRHGTHPRGSGDLENLFTGHLKTLLR